MRTRLRLACLVGLTAAGIAAAAAPPPRRLAVTEVERLIEQMGDRHFALRDRAMRRLQAEGLAALPYLRKAAAHRDVEVRRRALRMIPGLEHAALVSPRRFSMAVVNQPLSGVVAELARQSGYKVMLTHEAPVVAMGFPAVGPVGVGPGVKGPVVGQRRMSYTFVNAPFWDAIDRICRDNNLVVSQSWGDDTVRLSPSPGGYCPYAGRDGAFRYSASSLSLSRQVDLSTAHPTGGNDGRVDNLSFTFQVFAEPRLPFLGLGEIRVDAAYDSDRNSMLVPVGGANDPYNGGRFGRRYYGGSYKQMTMQASLSLQRASQKAATMKLLRGVLPVTLLVEQRPTPIADKVLTAKGKKATIGDLEFTVESVDYKKANNQVSVKFGVVNKGNPNDYSWMNNMYQRLELSDAKGEKFQNYGTNWHGNTGNSISLTMTYNPGGRKLGPPERFVFQHWVTRQHDVHFEFRDVPLP